MITISKQTNYYLAQIQAQPYRLVSAASDAAKNGTVYTLSYSENPYPNDQANLVLVSYAAYQAAVAGLDPADSLALNIRSISLATQAAAVRCIEVYHLVLGLSNFPGNEENTDLIDSGFEHKIYEEGATLLNEVETHTSAGGKVVANYPIASLGSISARKTGADLTVVSAVLPLGQVTLHDGMSAIADGVAVELRYQTAGNLIYLLVDQNQKPVAVIMSQSLSNYLAANA